MLKIGLTGGIACGKSRVLQVLSGAGLPTLDLDRVAHDVITPGGTAYADVLSEFGAGVLDADGRIDRKRLGALVFTDPAARQRLNAFVHPRVREAEVETTRAWQESGAPVGVIDAALLVETGAHLRFSRLVVVHCPAGVQRARLMSRDGLDVRAAEARLRAQMPIDDKRWFGHLEIDTSGRLEDTDARAAQLAATLRDLAEVLAPPSACPMERILGVLAHGASHGPGGITPTYLLEEIAKSGGLDLARLFDRLEPPTPGPWYERREALPGPGPQTLAPVLAAWCALLGRDGEQAATAMGSLARLVGASSSDAAAAVFLTVAFLDLMRRQGPLTVPPASVEGWGRLAERWGAGTAPDTVTALLARLPFLPAVPDAARRTAEGHGWDADAAAALASLRAGARPEDAPAVASALERLARGVQ